MKKIIIIFITILFFILNLNATENINANDPLANYLKKYHKHLKDTTIRNAIYTLAKSDPEHYKEIVSYDIKNTRTAIAKITAIFDMMLEHNNILKRGSDKILYASKKEKIKLIELFTNLYKNITILHEIADKYERDFWDVLFKDKKLYFEAYLLGNIALTMEFNTVIGLCQNVSSYETRRFFNEGVKGKYPRRAFNKLSSILGNEWLIARLNYFYNRQSKYLEKFYKNKWYMVDKEHWMYDYFKFNAPLLKKYLEEIKNDPDIVSALNDEDEFSYSPLADLLYPFQAKLFAWFGDIKLKRLGYGIISEKQLKNMIKKLKPGDIILERRNWYISNLFITGFWPHAILYVGTPEEIKNYIDSDLKVKNYFKRLGFNGLLDYLKKNYPKKWKKYTSLKHGDKIRVIESVSEGVIFNSIEESCNADYIAAMRPLLSKLDKALAIRDAFYYQGRDYDFNFDFVSENTLVCTELVVKAYGSDSHKKGLNFTPIVEFGKTVIKANTMCKDFDLRYNTNKKELEFVYFLKGLEKKKIAIVEGINKFRSSWRWKGGLVAEVE